MTQQSQATFVHPTSFFSPLCSVMSRSNTAPNSSWIFCISLMWLATLFMAFMATADEQKTWLALNCCDRVHSPTCSHQNNFIFSVNLMTKSYRPGGSAPHCLGLWASRAPSAGGDTSAPSGWVWSGMTPGWKSAVAWGCARPGRPWNRDRFWLEWP